MLAGSMIVSSAVAFIIALVSYFLCDFSFFGALSIYFACGFSATLMLILSAVISDKGEQLAHKTALQDFG